MRGAHARWGTGGRGGGSAVGGGQEWEWGWGRERGSGAPVGRGGVWAAHAPGNSQPAGQRCTDRRAGG